MDTDADRRRAAHLLNEALAALDAYLAGATGDGPGQFLLDRNGWREAALCLKRIGFGPAAVRLDRQLEEFRSAWFDEVLTIAAAGQSQPAKTDYEWEVERDRRIALVGRAGVTAKFIRGLIKDLAPTEAQVPAGPALPSSREGHEVPRGTALPASGGQPSLNRNEARILRCLRDHAPKLMTQEEIEAETRISVRTIGPCLARLRGLGFAHQPRGDRQGHTVTPAGKSAAG